MRLGPLLIAVFAFYLFAAVLITAAAATVLARNPVHSVLWLILGFFNAAGLMLLAGAEFIAMLLVIVYVGAVAVLFLFVVMMLDIDFASFRAGFARYLPLGLALAALLLAELVIVLLSRGEGAAQLIQRTAPTSAAVSNTQALGTLMYTRYLYLFEAVGLVLLVSMIGAIVLTHRGRGGGKPQSISRQVRRRPQDAVRMTEPTVGEGIRL